MDRSYLSDTAVVKASRQFVCARLASYEDFDEAALMKSIYRFRRGETKNSVFAILDPEGSKHLVRAGRSPRHTFTDATKMAARMQEIAKDYQKKTKRGEPDALGMPYLKNVRLAMNIAACDAQRLVIVYAPKTEDRDKLEALLTPLVWNDKLIGNLLYARTSYAQDLETIEGATDSPGFLVVEPDQYGTGARQVAFVKLGTKATTVEKALVAAADQNKMGSKDSKRHIGRGRRKGVRWETVTPVTDRGSRGRDRRRRRRDR